MTREEIREQTMQIIFQMDVAGTFDYNNLLPMDENLKALSKKQAIETLDIIRDHISDIDERIESCLDKNWNIDRIAKTDLAIIRNAVAEMLYIDSLPNAISINEAVNLAKKYGDDRSYAFVNSVLSKINQSIGN